MQNNNNKKGSIKKRIPKPPATHHIEPLPWQKPKPDEDDPGSPQRVQDLLSSASYRQADQDVEFLNRDDVRSVRLQLDFLKPELLLKQYGIEHTYRFK